jgi:hypothetical protein
MSDDRFSNVSLRAVLAEASQAAERLPASVAILSDRNQVLEEGQRVMNRTRQQIDAVARLREVNENARLTFDVEAFEIAKGDDRKRATRIAGRPTRFGGTHAWVWLDHDGCDVLVHVDLLTKRKVSSVAYRRAT